MTLSSPSRHAQYTRHLRPFAIAAYRLFIALSALALFRVASSLTGVLGAIVVGALYRILISVHLQ